MSSRAAYDGTHRKIVLAFDIGTTYSGISYSVLVPGEVPEIRAVERFPAQEHSTGASKVPTIIYYDQNGNVRAIGAEATNNGIAEAAEDGNWIKAEWFKLHLQPKFGEGQNISNQVPPLPPNKTVIEVFADFLKYLLRCAEAYIIDMHPSGANLWAALSDDIHFVLSHPNGWKGKEQSQMLQAAIKPGLVPNIPAGHERVSFMTEGEVSLYFTIENNDLSQIQKGEGIVIVDAGGESVHVSTYRRCDDQNGKSTFEEISTAQYRLLGSVFVTIAARVFLENLLADSAFYDDIDHIAHCFDRTTKLRFRDENEPQYVKFGSTRDNDRTCNIRFGQLKLAGKDVGKFFQPSIDGIVKSVKDQQRTALKITYVVLVGGFTANELLFNRVRIALTQQGLTVIRPEDRINKIVSNGAISLYLDSCHRKRSYTQKNDAGGVVQIPVFSNITSKLRIWFGLSRKSTTTVLGPPNGLMQLRIWFSLTRKPTTMALGPPECPDIDPLVKATEQAFHVIIPWCAKRDASPAIAEQMSKYGEAINLSIASAQTVYTIAEDAKAFIQRLEKSTTPEEIRQFLTGLANLAQEGLATTEKTLAAFKEVRTTIISLSAQSSARIEDGLPTLEKAAEVLEHFRSSVSSYVTWWTRMNMSMTQHANSSDEILQAYCELRKTKIIEKWEKLGAIFESYSDKMYRLQDKYPDILPQINPEQVRLRS